MPEKLEARTQNAWGRGRGLVSPPQTIFEIYLSEAKFEIMHNMVLELMLTCVFVQNSK